MNADAFAVGLGFDVPLSYMGRVSAAPRFRLGPIALPLAEITPTRAASNARFRTHPVGAQHTPR